MKIVLAAVEESLANAWEQVCGDVAGVSVHRGSILDVDCDAVVSPANSFGFMDVLTSPYVLFLPESWLTPLFIWLIGQKEKILPLTAPRTGVWSEIGEGLRALRQQPGMETEAIV